MGKPLTIVYIYIYTCYCIYIHIHIEPYINSVYIYIYVIRYYVNEMCTYYTTSVCVWHRLQTIILVARWGHLSLSLSLCFHGGVNPSESYQFEPTSWWVHGVERIHKHRSFLPSRSGDSSRHRLAAELTWLLSATGGFSMGNPKIRGFLAPQTGFSWRLKSCTSWSPHFHCHQVNSVSWTDNVLQWPTARRVGGELERSKNPVETVEMVQIFWGWPWWLFFSGDSLLSEKSSLCWGFVGPCGSCFFGYVSENSHFFSGDGGCPITQSPNHPITRWFGRSTLNSDTVNWVILPSGKLT